MLATKDEWKDFKIDIEFRFNTTQKILRVIPSPSTSVMLLRASTAKVKPFEERNLICGILEKGGHEVKMHKKLGPKVDGIYHKKHHISSQT